MAIQNNGFIADFVFVDFTQRVTINSFSVKEGDLIVRRLMHNDLFLNALNNSVLLGVQLHTKKGKFCVGLTPTEARIANIGSISYVGYFLLDFVVPRHKADLLKRQGLRY